MSVSDIYRYTNIRALIHALFVLPIVSSLASSVEVANNDRRSIHVDYEEKHQEANFYELSTQGNEFVGTWLIKGKIRLNDEHTNIAGSKYDLLIYELP